MGAGTHPWLACLAQVLQPLTAAPEQLAWRQQQLCTEVAAVLGWMLNLEGMNFGVVGHPGGMGRRRSRGSRQLLAFCVQHRQQWLDALRQAARLLNAAANGGPGGIQSWESSSAGVGTSVSNSLGMPPQQRDEGGTEVIDGALRVANGAGMLICYVHTLPPDCQMILDGQPSYAATAEGAAAAVEVSELLVRLAAKRASLNAVLESRLRAHPAELALASQQAAVERLLEDAMWLLKDSLKAPALVGPVPATGEGEARQRAAAASMHSLAASAAKLVRLMPGVPAMDTRGSGRHHYAQHVLELAVALCLRLLSLHLELLPGPTENLTGHLRWACRRPAGADLAGSSPDACMLLGNWS